MKYHVVTWKNLKGIQTPEDGDIAITHTGGYKVYRYEEDEDRWIRDLEEESIVKPLMEAEDAEIAQIKKETK